jgi:hypothetical protein
MNLMSNTDQKQMGKHQTAERLRYIRRLESEECHQ